jgi:(p)ppGpp synthase/HD superfamily hydrolase
MLTCAFLEDIEIEISKRLLALENPESERFSESLWELGMNEISVDDQEHLTKIFCFAASIDYHHVGLSPKAYLAHPTRVAGMTLFLSPNSEKKLLGTISLLHNVLEVSSVSSKKLIEEAGHEVADSIQILTVTRDLQENIDYLNNYYSSIKSTPHSLSVVKIIDKLDNLFMLGLNPDEAVRQRYLNEISHYVLPLVKQFLPQLANYFENLVLFNQANGMIDKEKYL